MKLYEDLTSLNLLTETDIDDKELIILGYPDV